MTKKELLEKKILEALEAKKLELAQYDADRKADYDELMHKAEIQISEYWKKDFQRSAEYWLSFQKHGYDFLPEWKNVISKAMYSKTYYIWHSAQAGRNGTGHGSYVTTELNEKEEDNVNEVFNRLVKRGYLKVSKSGKMATFTK